MTPSPSPLVRICLSIAMIATLVSGAVASEGNPLYTNTLAAKGARESYDEALAVATLQGVINRTSPRLYVLSNANERPRYWLTTFTQPGRWLAGRPSTPLVDLGTLVKLAGKDLRGAVIWDPDVPASVNVATTIAGVEDAVVLSPELAAKHLAGWKLPVVKDLRGLFTGKETGSKKNDAYRWAVREYLARGRCSAHWLCLYEDAFSARAAGDVGYIVTRDWAVKNRAFVFDLSPWGDELPGDDLKQKLGTDLETYRLILSETAKQSAGKQMTELAGFFAFAKYSNVPGHASAHDPVPTEWETVWLISPFNCYQNTVASDCFNQSLHSQAPRRPLTQQRPRARTALSNKAYISILMADYDSATPLYGFLPKHWDDPERGKLPLAWGINPNLIETYPDVFAYLYETATPNDHFTADASAAGYMNPNRVRVEHLPLFVSHNRRFFHETDMTMAPMVLDWDEPSAAVKDAFRQFAPDGFATIVMDLHGKGGKPPRPHVWKGMPVTELINELGSIASPETAAEQIFARLKDRPKDAPGFYFFRIVWVSPSDVRKALGVLRTKRPEVDWDLVDPYTFFSLFKEYEQAQRR
jgi:GxGYxYP putative glycoside hydrolase C-terminal domain/GxGYxY sequence motif in domain of unknown function N-terminal